MHSLRECPPCGNYLYTNLQLSEFCETNLILFLRCPGACLKHVYFFIKKIFTTKGWDVGDEMNETVQILLPTHIQLHSGLWRSCVYYEDGMYDSVNERVSV